MELKISPQWTVVVHDMSGSPQVPGIKVSQTWSYWLILDDQEDEKVTDVQGRVVFPPRSISANPVRLKLAEGFGSLPHVGAAQSHRQRSGYTRTNSKDLDEYFNVGSGFLAPESADSKTANGPEGLTTTLYLRPIDLIDAIKRVGKLYRDFTRAKAILAWRTRFSQDGGFPRRHASSHALPKTTPNPRKWPSF